MTRMIVLLQIRLSYLETLSYAERLQHEHPLHLFYLKDPENTRATQTVEHTCGTRASTSLGSTVQVE